jgi:hypothetical protein
MTIEEVNELAEGAILLDGYDDCIVGVTEEFGNETRILYSREKIINKLKNDMSEEDALEFYYYNIIGGYFGERNPIFIF